MSNPEAYEISVHSRAENLLERAVRLINQPSSRARGLEVLDNATQEIEEYYGSIGGDHQPSRGLHLHRIQREHVFGEAQQAWQDYHETGTVIRLHDRQTEAVRLFKAQFVEGEVYNEDFYTDQSWNALLSELGASYGLLARMGTLVAVEEPRSPVVAQAELNYRQAHELLVSPGRNVYYSALNALCAARHCAVIGDADGKNGWLELAKYFKRWRQDLDPANAAAARKVMGLTTRLRLLLINGESASYWVSESP